MGKSDDHNINVEVLYYNKLKDDLFPSELYKVFWEAINSGQVEIVRQLIDQGVDVNTEVDGVSPIQLACQRGHFEILESLLHHPELDVSPSDALLCTAIREWGESQPQHKGNYFECFKLLMHSPRIDINQVDKNNCSPLYYASNYRNESAVTQLLKRSAYIGTKSNLNYDVMRSINPEILENYLDTCITSNGLNWYDPDYEIHIDFTCLVPPNTESMTLEIWPKKVKFHEEVIPIEYIAHTPELEHLLKHPVISSFLFLKWYQFHWNYWLGVSMEYSVFLFFIATTSFYLGTRSYFGDSVLIYRLLLCLQVVLHSFTCGVNIFRQSFGYFQSFKHCTQLALIVLMWILVIYKDIPESNNRPIYSLFIMLAATNFYSLFCAMPYLSISIHAHMFRTVTSNFLRSFVFFFVYLVAFAFSFHLLFYDGQEDGSKSDACADENSEFHSFSNVGVSFLKTMVMLTGEYEAADMKFDNIVSYFTFVLFIFVISITLLNLLNGLAVSDIQAIKRDAELINLKQRSILLCDYERKFNHQNHDFDYCKKMLIKFWLMTTSCLFSDLIQSTKIKILPNHPKCLIVAQLVQIEGSGTHKTLNIQMDRDIIQFSKCCIERKLKKERLEAEKQLVADRLKSIVTKMDNVEKKIALVTDHKLTKIEENLNDSVSVRLQNIEERLKRENELVNGRLHTLESKLEADKKFLIERWATFEATMSDLFTDSVSRRKSQPRPRDT